MKAARIVKPGRVEIVEISAPRPGAGEVVVRMQCLGLCGSDLKTYRNENPMVTFPRIPGHEIAGVIAEVGSEVPSALKIGDRVTVSPYTACGNCSACRAGRLNTCRYNQTFGVQRDGAAAELLLVPWQKIVPAAGLSFEQIACIEPLSVGWHAANRGQVKALETVVVFGCGVIGLGALLAAVYKGANVVAVDIDDAKLQQARRLGVQHLVNSAKEDLSARLAQIAGEMHGGEDSADVVIEAVGLPATFQKAVDVVGFAGRVVYIGYAKAPVSYETKYFVSKELDIRGSRNALQEEIAQVAEMLQSGTVDIEPLITHRFPFEESAKALEFWNSHPQEVTKILLDF